MIFLYQNERNIKIKKFLFKKMSELSKKEVFDYKNICMNIEEAKNFFISPLKEKILKIVMSIKELILEILYKHGEQKKIEKIIFKLKINIEMMENKIFIFIFGNL